jgi:hypothetical protein
LRRQTTADAIAGEFVASDIASAFAHDPEPATPPLPGCAGFSACGCSFALPASVWVLSGVARMLDPRRPRVASTALSE